MTFECQKRHGKDQVMTLLSIYFFVTGVCVCVCVCGCGCTRESDAKVSPLMSYADKVSANFARGVTY